MRRSALFLGLGPGSLRHLLFAHLGPALADRHFEFDRRPARVVEVGEGDPRQGLVDRPLDIPQIVLFFGGNEGERFTG
jgi:hypothetical protein